jgi:hypothetical protein
MSSPRIALIHATFVAIEPIVSAFKQLWPEARTTNLLEDSLSADLPSDGRLSAEMTGRFVTLENSAHGCGADAILFTCSAFGPAIDTAGEGLDFPVLKPQGPHEPRLGGHATEAPVRRKRQKEEV